MKIWGTYRITVDYSCPIRDLTQGKYESTEPEIHDKNFPPRWEGDPVELETLIVQPLWGVFEDRRIARGRTEKVLEEFEKASLRPGDENLREFLSLFDQHPEISVRGYQGIYDLGSRLIDANGYRLIACVNAVGQYNQKRGLSLVWYGLNWPLETRFLAFRK